MISSSWFCLIPPLLLLSVLVVHSKNILFLQTTPSRSHHIWNWQIFYGLFENGHNLTVLTFEPEQSVPGMTFLYVDNFHGKIMARLSVESDDGSRSEMGPIENIVNMYGFYEIASQVLIEEEALQQLLKYPASFKFDLVIHDFTMGQFLLGFLERFGNPPLVSISAFNAPSYTAQLTGGPIQISTLPNYAACFGQRMTLLERAWNSFYWALDYYHRQHRFMPNENQRLRKLFGSNARSVAELEKRSDLVLVNSDLSMDYYQIFPANVISVGGLHIARSEVIPEDIVRFMARPTEAVILLSLGTNVKSENLGKGVNQAILNVFSSLPNYNFIWKHGEPDALGTIPENVLVRKWIPQVALLADPRTKLLIGHGGLLGLQEATWYGVPVVGIPFFADQYQNVDKLVRAGVGVRMLPEEIGEESLKIAVMMVLTNGSYHQRAVTRSKQFRNQPQPPLDRALFWIEQVLDHKGLPHLRSPPTSLYQQYGLDLAVAPFVILALLTHLMLSLACTNKRC